MHWLLLLVFIQPSTLSTVQATLAAANVAGMVSGFPVWNKQDILPFIEKPVPSMPHAAPSIVNAKELKLAMAADP